MFTTNPFTPLTLLLSPAALAQAGRSKKLALRYRVRLGSSIIIVIIRMIF